MADPSGPRTIAVPTNGTNSVSFVLPPGITLDVESVLAEIDATAAGDTTAELVISEQNGVPIAAVRQSQVIPGGDTGRATWALRLTDSVGQTATVLPWAAYIGNAVSCANNGNVALTLNTLNGGTPLLDLTNPAAPAWLASGVYAVTAVFATDAGTPLPAGAFFLWGFDIGQTAIVGVGGSSPPSVAGAQFPSQPVTLVGAVTAGDTLAFSAGLRSGVAARSFEVNACSIQQVA